MSTREQYGSAFGGDIKAAERLGVDNINLAESRSPQASGQEKGVLSTQSATELGAPMRIGEVASLLGCSVWTVRQRYLPIGLPYFRIGSAGKLTFYRNQIVRWILEKQRQKGGEIR
jgi:hypothetical protein